jgi:hypothetical protein
MHSVVKDEVIIAKRNIDDLNHNIDLARRNFSGPDHKYKVACRKINHLLNDMTSEINVREFARRNLKDEVVPEKQCKFRSIIITSERKISELDEDINNFEPTFTFLKDAVVVAKKILNDANKEFRITVSNNKPLFDTCIYLTGKAYRDNIAQYKEVSTTKQSSSNIASDGHPMHLCCRCDNYHVESAERCHHFPNQRLNIPDCNSDPCNKPGI